MSRSTVHPAPGSAEASTSIAGKQTPARESTRVYQYDLDQGAYLVVLEGPEVGRRILLSRKVVTLGRSPTADVILADPEVSLNHAEILCDGDTFVLRDAGSRNGVMHQGRLVSEVPLASGDEFSVCRNRFRFLQGPAAETDPDSSMVIEEPTLTEKAPQRRNRLAHRLVPAGVGLLLLILILSLTRSWLNLPQVNVAPVTHGPLQQVTSFSGRLVPKHDVRIFPTVAAPVVKLLAEVGQTVEPGDPILALDPEILGMAFEKARADLTAGVAAVRTADAALRSAERKHREDQALAKKGILSRAEVEASSANVNARRADASTARATQRQAETRLAQAKRDHADTVVRAPIVGQVTAINLKVGENTGDLRGVPLVTIEDPSELLAEVSASEAKIGLLRIGQSATIYVSGAGLGTEFTGKVVQIAPKAQTTAGDTGATVYAAKVGLDQADPRLRIGMQVQVRILTAEKAAALTVPLAAVVTGGRAMQGVLEQVAVIDSGSRAHWVPVETDLITPDRVEIVSGPPAGALIIVGPVDLLLKLKEGDRVRTTTAAPR